ncbi:MAG: class I SAM-dependent methyltransferase [Burkholderiaceae bacterium]|nr:class I SAM-dependent methyltransferase [Burkholderiaceae bacterium]
MNLQGPQFYDNDGVFNIYQKRRQRAASPNDTLERPVIRELLGDVKAHDFLDLGCGDAAFGKELLAAGASSCLGVDGSHNMILLAQATLQGTGGQVVHADLQTWPYPEAGFSRVCCRLALHYLPELDATFRAVHRALRPGGRFVFSVEHPVITSCNEAMRDTALRQDWLVDNYFNTGQRVNDWMSASVIKYHRTIEDHFHALQCSGFRVEALRESRPVRQHFASEDDFVRRHRIPLFLFMTASKLTP